MNILICNIGTRDIQIPDTLFAKLFPGLPSYRVPERTRAQTLLARYDELAPEVALPIIAKAMRHVKDHARALPNRVVLIASDQPSPPASADHHSKDTIDTARLIQRLIVDRYAIVARQIEVVALRDEPSAHNPADYDGVMRAMSLKLNTIQAAHPGARCYLEITGGTPAMTTALLLVGTRVFGRNAIPITVTPSSEMVYRIEAGRQLLQHTMREVVLSDLDIYSYGSALQTYQRQRDLFADYQLERTQQLTEALLRYAHQRLNLDFEGCRNTLSGVTGAAALPHGEIARLYEEVLLLDPAWLLREIYFGAAIKFERGEYADFVGRVFRLHEGALRALVERWGGRFDATRPGHFDRAWLESLPPLGSLFSGQGGALQTSVSRPRLAHVAALLAQHQPDTAATRAVEYLKRIDALALLRNQTQIAHGFAGLSRQVLADYFLLSEQQRGQGRRAPEQDAGKIVVALEEIVVAVTGQPIGVSPFAAINVLLQRLLTP